MRPRTDVAAWRGALWAARALVAARRQLRARPLGEVRVGAPPALPSRAERGVTAVLRRGRASCLERSLVLQRWHAAHGERHDVVIGVTGPADFLAHAWLDGELDLATVPYREVTRLRP